MEKPSSEQEMSIRGENMAVIHRVDSARHKTTQMK